MNFRLDAVTESLAFVVAEIDAGMQELSGHRPHQIIITGPPWPKENPITGLYGLPVAWDDWIGIANYDGWIVHGLGPNCLYGGGPVRQWGFALPGEAPRFSAGPVEVYRLGPEEIKALLW